MLFGYCVYLNWVDLLMDCCDLVFVMLKVVVVDEVFDWSNDCCLDVLWCSIVIYEIYVCGVLMCCVGLCLLECGMFVLFVYLVFIDYLLLIGVMMVELLLIYVFL